jgi:hypothetical protein
MKGWCKILELDNYDILVQRLATKEDGENVSITVRMPDGQFIKTASLGDGEDAEKKAIELFETYEAKDAKLFIDELDKLITANDTEENKDTKD